MASQNHNNYRLFGILGLALTLPMILIGGPLAGFILGHAAVKYLSGPKILITIGMILGLAGSGIQSVRIIQKIKEFSSKEDRRQS
ncbi:MAG: hypothetical protein PHN49_01115 [Candidatus Omnitrophica bacterium]|nr:hypothetical protein [Candidatus Omnitrophota bacterium]MDD5670219.1 hypothetical protein [Candidatus Omnitrophota bacterium]